MAKRSTNAQIGTTWEELSLPIQGGADLRSNARSRPMAKLAKVINGSFTERNSVVKRAGHRGGPVLASNNNSIPFPELQGEEWVYGHGKATFGNGSAVDILWHPDQPQLLAAIAREGKIAAWTGDRLFSHTDSTDQWFGGSTYWLEGLSTDPIPRGTPLYVPAGPVEDLPIRASLSGTQHQVAKGRHCRLIAWLTGGELWARVEDLGGSVVMEDTAITGGTDTSGNPQTLGTITFIKALYLGSYLGLVVGDSAVNRIWFLRLPELATDAGWLMDTLTDTNADADNWDVCKVDDLLGLVAWHEAGDDVAITYFRAEGVAQFPAASLTVLDTSQTATGPVAVCTHHNGDIGVVWVGTDTFAGVYTGAGVLKDATVTIDTGSAEFVGVCATALLDSDDLPQFVGYADVDAATPYTRVRRFDEAAASATATEQRFNVRIASGAFAVGDVPCITVVTRNLSATTRQTTYVLQMGIKEPRIGGAWARSSAVEPDDGDCLPTSVDFAPDQSPRNRTKWCLSFSHQPRILPPVEAGLTIPTATSQNAETRGLFVDLDFLPRPDFVQHGRSIYISGAQPHVWDGQATHEAGFLQWPEHTTAPTASDIAPSAPWDTDTGTFPANYQYRVYFCRRNRYGEVSRSPAVTSATVSVPDASTKVTLTLSTLDVTEDEDVYYEIYRTLADGLVFHLISGFDAQSAVQNVRNAATVTYEDTTPDSTAEDRPTDPHNPVAGAFAELEETALPGCEVMALAGERLWFAGGLVPPGRAYYSKFQEPGEQAAWNDLGVLEFVADTATDRITAIGDLAGSPVLFRGTKVYQVPGDGPDNLGLGSYGLARPSSTDLGAQSQKGVVKVPDGLAFWSDQGPRVLTEQLAVAVLGDEVAPAAEGRTCVAALVNPKASQARWYLDNGNVLVYDYITRFWAEHTGLDAAHAVAGPDGAVVVRTDAKVLFEDETLKTDAGNPYEFVFKTAELRRAELLQGVQRIRRWSISGEWRGPHTLKARIFYDGSPYEGEVKTWAVTGDLDNVGWGSGTGTFGTASSLWPSTTSSSADGVYRTRRRLTRQRASSVSFEFSDSGAAGDSFVISELGLEVGGKDGLTRLPSRTFS